MPDDQVFKQIILTGTSKTSIEEAVQVALAKAAKTVRNLRWFEIDEIRGAIDGTSVMQWQVTVKIGFVVED